MAERAVAYCGLWCEGCPLFTGRAAGLARDLKAELDAMRFEKAVEAMSKIPVFKALEGYPACRGVLDVIEQMHCPATCRGGGGNPRCAIRLCCKDKGFEGCWECGGFETCGHLRILENAHGTAHLVSLRTIAANGLDAFLAGDKPWFTD
jgi:hypothetical protein